MYYPYFRGKQYELLLLRDSAELLSDNNIHPIIEPVKANPAALNRAIASLVEKNVHFTFIINPQVGELKGEYLTMDFIADSLNGHTNYSLGYIVNASSRISEIRERIGAMSGNNFSIVHYGFEDGRALSELFEGRQNISEHIFIDGFARKLYQLHFATLNSRCILIRDGFRARINREYPLSEPFSDLHVTYEAESVDGFGDFSIVGDEFSESGGPAYAVAIHLTYLKSEDNDMSVYHFVSDQNSSPINPAGKFAEALRKLIDKLNEQDSNILETNACNQFRELFSREHFPGLGKVKQISMQHHLELIAHYLTNL